MPVAVIAEVTWVLALRYGYERAEIARAVAPFVMADGVHVEGEDVVFGALTLMAERNVDFADGNHAAVARKRGEPVATFDADLRRLGATLFPI